MNQADNDAIIKIDKMVFESQALLYRENIDLFRGYLIRWEDKVIQLLEPFGGVMPKNQICEGCTYESAIWPASTRCKSCVDGHRYFANPDNLQARIKHLEKRVSDLESESEVRSGS
jgi:hypothetical protein